MTKTQSNDNKPILHVCVLFAEPCIPKYVPISQSSLNQSMMGPENHGKFLDVILTHILVSVSYHHGLLHNWRCVSSKLHSLNSQCWTRLSSLKYICGNLNFYESESINMTWDLVPLVNYSTLLYFHHFEIMYSKHCEIAAVVIHKIFLHPHQDVYCGFIPPWNESCPCKNIAVKLQRALSYITTKFNISYSITRVAPLTVVIATHIITVNTTVEFDVHQHFVTNMKQFASIYIYTQKVNLIQFMHGNKGEY